MNTVLLTKNFQNGLDKTLALVYNIVRSENLFNDIEIHRPTAIFANIADFDSLRVLDQYPYIKIVLEYEKRGFSVEFEKKHNPYLIESVYGFNPFQQLIPVNRTFDAVCVCDRDESNEWVLDLDVTRFGSGWPNSYGVCHASSIYAVSDKVVYAGKKPSDDLINALYFCGKVYGKIDFDKVLQPQELNVRYYKVEKKYVFEKYNYPILADRFCNYLGIPEYSFTERFKNVSNNQNLSS